MSLIVSTKHLCPGSSLVLEKPVCRNYQWSTSNNTSSSHSKRTAMNVSERKTGYIFVVGAPGAGKGTLCNRLADLGQHYHLSVGDYLRLYTMSVSPAEQNPEIVAHVKAHTLVPAELLIPQLKGHLQRLGPDNTVTIIDGFPRAANQCELFEQQVVQHLHKTYRDANFCTDRRPRPGALLPLRQGNCSYSCLVSRKGGR